MFLFESQTATIVWTLIATGVAYAILQVINPKDTRNSQIVGVAGLAMVVMTFAAFMFMKDTNPQIILQDSPPHNEVASQSSTPNLLEWDDDACPKPADGVYQPMKGANTIMYQGVQVNLVVPDNLMIDTPSGRFFPGQMVKTTQFVAYCNN